MIGRQKLLYTTPRWCYKELKRNNHTPLTESVIGYQKFISHAKNLWSGFKNILHDSQNLWQSIKNYYTSLTESVIGYKKLLNPTLESVVKNLLYLTPRISDRVSKNYYTPSQNP